MVRETQDEHPLMGPGRNRLAGKVAIVTGADSGIGRASARLFAREGAKVVCVDLRESGRPRVDRLIQEDGGEAVFVNGDVSRPADCELMVRTAIESFSGVHVLFNNAGTGLRKQLHELSDEEWQFVVDVNLKGMFNGVRAVLPHFLEQGRGNIVSTASSFGIRATESYPSYCATKAAIVNLTRQIAIDYGPGVRANCVCPGPTATPRWRGIPPAPRFADRFSDADLDAMGQSVKALHRGARPEEIAYAALFLASDESSFVTGHALVVDGGQTLSP
jgi:NAD(P)-dependent dehydrogenase (short-subunit alcohol dehydrogenase family)